jgi:excinuclease ABC subunit A
MVDAVLALPEDTRLMVLAPVVRDRKGEFAELFADMQAQGYVRFRIDGDGVVEADDAAAAEEEREARHRRGDRPPARCARHEAAPGRELRGRAAHRRRPRHRAGAGQAGGQEHLFSSQVRLPGVQLRAAELEPRLFSFNSPVGACPSCDGLGQVTVFDPERVVAFPT